MAKAGGKPKPASKSEIYNALAEASGVSRKQVAAFMDALTDLVAKNVGKKGPGVFALPGLLKITTIRKPATKATTKANPFKPGEMMTVAAKPARTVVKVRPLKGLKAMV